MFDSPKLVVLSRNKKLVVNFKMLERRYSRPKDSYPSLVIFQSFISLIIVLEHVGQDSFLGVFSGADCHFEVAVD